MLNPFANRKLLRRGEPARARIVEMSTREHGAEPSNVSMTLAVDFRGAGPYEVTDRWMISGTEPISSGSEIWVVVDPENRHRVTIDWDRTRAEYRERTDVRRRVLSTGIPIPVSKVREALEEAGELRSTAVADAADDDEEEVADEPEVEAPAEIEEPAPAIVAVGATVVPTLPADPLAGLSLHERDLLAQHVPMPLAQATAVTVAPPVPAPVKMDPARVPVATASRGLRRVPPVPVVAPGATDEATDEDDMTSKLERLAALNAAGALTDGEFSAAKAHVLTGG